MNDIKIISENPYAIKDVKEQTESLCMLAIYLKWDSIQFIKNPTNEMIELSKKLQRESEVTIDKNLFRRSVIFR